MAAVVVAATTFTSGCSSSDGGAGGGPASTPTGVLAQATGPAGTAIAEGLVVPEGARLAGDVFMVPSELAASDDWSAHLVVDGDVFAVWDDLAGQLRDGDPHAAMSGSADACLWVFPEDAVLPGSGTGEDAGQGAAVVPGYAAEGAEVATSTTTAPQPDPYLTAATVTGEAPDLQVNGVECSAAAQEKDGGSIVRYTMHLRSGVRWPATITLEANAMDARMETRPTASRTSTEMQARPGGGPDIIPGPEPVPEGAADYVPDAMEQESPEPGGPFGLEVNCFVSDGGYHRLDLPTGAAFVAGGFSDGAASVISVPDAGAAIADLQRQTSGDGTSEDGPGTVETRELSGGATVTVFRFSVSGGGGACAAISSPDGKFLLVSVAGD